MPKKQNEEVKLIIEVIGERKLRETAAWFNEKLPKPFQRSHMSVWNWINDVNKPDDVLLHGLREFYPVGDARHEMAVKILKMRGIKSVSWAGMDEQNGKKLLGKVNIRTAKDGTLVHEGEE